MRVTLVVNPVASSFTAARRDRVAAALGSRHALDVVETEHRGHAIELARRAAEDGADVVVALGGDGAVNEVANGLAGTATSLAPLPGGSTNVYARTVGYHPRLGRALAQLQAALDTPGFARRVHLGVAGERRFCFHAGIGFDAAVIERVDRRPAILKRHVQNTLFGLSAVATWRDMRDRTPRFDLYAGDDIVIGGAAFAIVSKTSPYTYLGPRRLLVAPDASFDSALAVTAIKEATFRSLMGAAGSALATGRRLLADPDAVYASGLAAVTLRAAAPVPYQLDGELIGEAAELELGIDEQALSLVMPAGGALRI